MDKVNGKKIIAEILRNPAKLRTAIVRLIANNELSLRDSNTLSEERKNALNEKRRELQVLLTMMKGEDEVSQEVYARFQNCLIEETRIGSQ